MFHRTPSKYDNMTKWEILDSINSDPHYSHGKMATKAIVAARKMVKKETSAREEAMQKLNDRISNATI